MDSGSSMSSIVASPSMIGGIAATSVIRPNATTHSQVIALVMVRNPDDLAVAASTDASA